MNNSNNIGGYDSIYGAPATDVFGGVNTDLVSSSKVKRQVVAIDPLAAPSSSYNQSGESEQASEQIVPLPPPSFSKPPTVDVVEIMTAMFISLCR